MLNYQLQMPPDGNYDLLRDTKGTELHGNQSAGALYFVHYLFKLLEDAPSRRHPERTFVVKSNE
jgi:hypothetical protein